MNPENEEIRRIHSGYLIVKKGWYARKAKLSYPLEIINNNNINTTEDWHKYKQLFFLYQNLSALLLYLQRQWSNSGIRSEENLKKWIQLAGHLKKQLK